MILVAEMESGGVFEASSKRKLTDQMTQHLCEVDCCSSQIRSIACVFEDGRTKEFCAEVVEKFQNIIDEGVAEWQKIADQEHRGRQELQSDYLAGVL